MVTKYIYILIFKKVHLHCVIENHNMQRCLPLSYRSWRYDKLQLVVTQVYTGVTDNDWLLMGSPGCQYP